MAKTSLATYSSKIPYARAVSRLYVPASPTSKSKCSCTMINSEGETGRPYVLTAAHCIDVNDDKYMSTAEINNLAGATLDFQFWKTTCPGSTINPGIRFTGVVLRAYDFSTDYALIELIEAPGIGDRI